MGIVSVVLKIRKNNERNKSKVLFRKEIDEKINILEHKESNWNVAGYTVLGAITTIALAFGFAFFEPAFPGERMTFGTDKHEVFFDKEDFSEPQIQKLGKMLTELEYFYEGEKQAVRVEQRDGTVFLLMPFHEDFWENQNIINELNNFNIRLQYEFKNQTTLELIHYELSGDMKTKEIRSLANKRS